MANHYCESSSIIPLPPDQRENAMEIVKRVNEALYEEEDYVGYMASLDEDGVWVRHDESITPEHVERLVKTLVEELNLDGVFVCSWSYTCSKPRIDEFGGGAFAVQKGKPTQWVDARDAVEKLAKEKQ